MPKNTYARTIYYLCEDKNKANRTIEKVEQQLGQPIPKMEPEELMLAFQQHRHRILMFDYKDFYKLNSQIKALPLAHKNFETILFNLEQRLTTDELLNLGQLKGLFYRTDSIDNIAQGCAEIINGENWLPRKVTAQLLYHYRNVIDSQTAPATVDLTTREIQILRSLIGGASNMQISEDLFISEFTVKSHLYQIFKKLCVKNRVQAAAWARQHMLS